MSYYVSNVVISWVSPTEKNRFPMDSTLLTWDLYERYYESVNIAILDITEKWNIECDHDWVFEMILLFEISQLPLFQKLILNQV